MGLRHDREIQVFGALLALMIFLALFGPMIAPYNFDEIVTNAQGNILINEPPSFAHPFGTTVNGNDVLSRFLYGARPTVITGLLGGICIITIGTLIGVTAGYSGGKIDNALMRFTDFIYTIPVLPAAIVLLSLFGINRYTGVLVIAGLLWRGSARVLRSQVLQIKQRPFVKAAKATGMSSPRIMLKHIIPNVAPMMVLYISTGIGVTIIIQAGLAFIGVTSPFYPAWGVMIRNTYNAGMISTAPWWIIPPSAGISLVVLSSFMFGRKYEELVGGETQEAASFEAGG